MTDVNEIGLEATSYIIKKNHGDILMSRVLDVSGYNAVKSFSSDIYEVDVKILYFFKRCIPPIYHFIMRKVCNYMDSNLLNRGNRP